MKNVLENEVNKKIKSYVVVVVSHMTIARRVALGEDHTGNFQCSFTSEELPVS